jgi:hypothetical protein
MVDIERIGYLVNLIKEKLSDSYLLGLNSKTYVIVFKPEKLEEVKKILEVNSASYGGVCFYFFGYSVALWDDLYDVIGFKGEGVCCVEIFDGSEINKEFYWRHKDNQLAKIKR